VFPSWDHEENFKNSKKKFQNPFRMVMITCAAAKDESWNERWPKRTVVTLVAPVEYDVFGEWTSSRPDKDRPFEYHKLKEFLTERLLKVLHAQYPQTEGKQKVYKSLKTPLDKNDNFALDRGEESGLEHTPER
jgi:hypothetical protein